VNVLVFLHHLELGGSQTNGIELAAAVRDLHGHDVTVLATPGPAVALVERHGIRYLPAPRPRVHPSPALARAVRRAVREHRADVVHAWDWPQCVDAFFGAALTGLAPVVGSDMSMDYNRRLPASIPVTYGTPQLVEEARARHAGPVTLLEPPVDADRNAPGAVPAADLAAFRAEHGLEDGWLELVIVSRLVEWMKLEGVLAAIDAVERLADLPARLVVVGGGTAFDRIAERAAAANGRLERRAVVLTGPLADPRPAYAAADVVLGMGGSILRGLAFGRPCVVLGERGFSEPFAPDSARRFLWQGFYGVGEGREPRLAGQLAALLGDPGRREELGRFSRRVVEERFSLEAGARTVDRLYREAVAARAPRLRRVRDAAGTGARQLLAGAAGRVQRRRARGTR
jgi:glycosyltransferase involved in cell wall biosynthesis